ncbi:MAG TPA: folylpolyglutamate synthase/dihydrofolate synthase family protein [Chitinophagaceae bacterium]
MNYSETIDYLFTRLPMFSRMGSAAFKKDLTNTIVLCEALGNPHRKFKSIHVGGTNGKGSVSHMLAAVLQTAGYKTGLYTSPHLYDFRERIRINGDLVSEDFVVSFVERIRPLIEKVSPSFFEITVAMAFDYFASQEVDISIVEVGLGGRLDSTNIITPELSVITNIGLDHTNMLGTTLQEIAGEKAGIIKKGVPVVIGEKHPETEPVFTEKAHKENAPLYFAEDHYEVTRFSFSNDSLAIEVNDRDAHTEAVYQLDLPGVYQEKNIKTVLQAIRLLKKQGWVLTEEHTHAALSSVKKLTGLHGRWEIIHRHPDIVLEVAHNEDGVRQMVRHLEDLSYQQLHIVYGMVKDKEAGPVLALLPKEATYYFTQAHIPRALSAGELSQKAETYGLQGKTYEDVNKALQAAKASASGDDLVLVCGSIFLVAEVDKGRV